MVDQGRRRAPEGGDLGGLGTVSGAHHLTGGLSPQPGPAVTVPGVGEENIARYVDLLLSGALARRASDIHVEGGQEQGRVRFRIDGLLRTVDRPPAGLRGRVVARLKVLGGLDIAERRLPQDGRLQVTLPDAGTVDFRISTLPTVSGEKVVLRVVDNGMQRRALSSLGMLPEQLHLFEQALSRPQGLILVTGPTGSGKTATLYAALSRLNTEARNIATVEDPVEAMLDGVNQVQRNARAGLDFSVALRALLRQDPDVLMIGEIRDQETAAIAVKAAQTGHLVLSTLHTTDAPRAVTRLLDMGVSGYNLAASLSLVVAQRLVRCLCPQCRRQRIAIGEQAVGEASGLHWEAVGCSGCDQGFRGRTGIYQVMPFDALMADRMVADGHGASLSALSRQAGVLDLWQAGMVKVQSGVTTMEELERVTTL